MVALWFLQPMGSSNMKQEYEVLARVRNQEKGKEFFATFKKEAESPEQAQEQVAEDLEISTKSRVLYFQETKVRNAWPEGAVSLKEPAPFCLSS